METRFKSKLFIPLLILVLLFSTGIVIQAADFAGGDGTETSPYEIANWYHLNNIRSYPDSHFVLVNDLDKNTDGYDELAGKNANKGAGWDPIGKIDDQGNFAKTFSGTFEGNDKTIKGLFIDRKGGAHVGLFMTVFGGVVRDLTLEGVVVNCESEGEVGTGALAGASIESEIVNVGVTGSVTSIRPVGGITGLNMGETSKIVTSYSKADVAGPDAGGLAGWNGGTIANSYSAGSVTGKATETGIVRILGGLAAFNGGTIDKSYSAAEISGEGEAESFGGLLGVDNGTVSNSFWDIGSSGVGSSAGGTGKTASEIRNVATFTDTSTEGLSDPWDFASDPYDDSGEKDLWLMEGGPQLEFEETVKGKRTTKYIQVENPGWSMVSVPLKPENNSPMEVFDGVGSTDIYHYDAGKGEFVTPEEGYKVEALHGTWAYLDDQDAPKVFTIAGLYAGDVTITLKHPGWHQVGTPIDYGWSNMGVTKEGEETMTVAAQANAPDAPHWMSQYLWEYDGEDYTAYKAGNSNFTMEEGKAYWVRTRVPNVQLEIPHNAPPPMPGTTATAQEAGGIPMSSKKADQLELPNPPAPPKPLSQPNTDLAVNATPNPVTSTDKVTFTVVGNDLDKARLSVYDASGKTIHETEFAQSKQLTWDLSETEASNGVYLYTVEAKRDGKILTSSAETLLVLK